VVEILSTAIIANKAAYRKEISILNGSGHVQFLLHRCEAEFLLLKEQTG
jgi:hypothetical protein